MKSKFCSNIIFVCALLLSPLLKLNAQVSGNVFRDINNDGTRQTINPAEPWEYGVIVNAYNSANALLGTKVTDNSGYYSFSAIEAPAGTAVRLQFVLTADNQPSKPIAADKSNIQFVVAGPSATNGDFAIASKKYYSDNANPYLATTAYVNGDPNSSGANSPGDKDNLYIFPYDLSDDGGSTRRAANKYTGSVFGLAWQKESRILLMSAYLKRHSGFGPGGIGAIYQTQIDKTGVPTTPTMLLDVTVLGIDVGTNPRTSVLPIDSRLPNTDDGVFAEVGKRGIGGMELNVDGRELYIVNMYEKKLQRILIGNPIRSSFSFADVTGSWSIPDPSSGGTIWHPMALKMHENKFYVGGVCVRETTGPYDIADTAGMKAVVYEFDPATSIFSKVLEFPLTYRKGFSNSDYRYEFRNNYWSAWQNNGDISLGGPLRSGLIGATTGSNATGIYYAQPLLSAIAFDVDGSMVLGVRDRFGDQGGYANYFETGNVPGETYRTLSTGEVLRAGRGAASQWYIENTGSVTTNGVTTTTPGVTDNNVSMTGSFAGQTGTPWGGTYGPGGGYFYYNHNYSLTNVPAPFNVAAANQSHYIKSIGGLAYLPGYNEIVTTAIDPTSSAFSNGIIKNVNSGIEAGNMAARMDLIVSIPGDPSFSGKAASLGDLEILIDAAAIEIGNRVWLDNDDNGRQDAGENGIANVTVVLRSPGMDNIYNNADDQTWTVITDANGNYYFDNSIVNDVRRPPSWIGVSATNSGVLPGFEYRIEIDATQSAISGLNLIGQHWASNDIDSDGSQAGSLITAVINPGGPTAANSVFSNNYDVDFGFYYSILPVNQLTLSASLKNNMANVNWQTKDEDNVLAYYVERSLNGVDFTTITNTTSKGNGSFIYDADDDITGITAKAIYYRIRTKSNTGSIKYSSTAVVKPTQMINLNVSPNPFVNELSIKMTSDVKTIADVRLSNLAGKTIYQEKIKIEKGDNSFVISELARFAKGIYVVEIHAGDINVKQKVVKQ